MKAHNPTERAAPQAPYSHGMEAPAGARWLYISGQVAIQPDGTVPEGLVAQTAVVFANLDAVLASAGMSKEDLVKVTMFLTQPENVAPFRALRDRWLGTARLASTLVVVQSLVRPEWLLEVEAVAADSRR